MSVGGVGGSSGGGTLAAPATEALAGAAGADSVSMAMLSQSLDMAAQMTQQLIESLPAAPSPGSGQHVDFYV